MKPIKQIIAAAMAGIILLTAVVVIMQRPILRLTQSSVVRDVRIINSGQQQLSVVVVRVDSGEVLGRVSVATQHHAVVRVFSGDSTRDFDDSVFAFIAWTADRASRSVLLNGLEIDAQNGRVEFQGVEGKNQ